MNPAVFQPGGPGGEEEEEEGSFHTRISPPTPPFLTLLVYAEHGILHYLDLHIRHFNSFGCFVSSSHSSHGLDGRDYILSRWRSEEC